MERKTFLRTSLLAASYLLTAPQLPSFGARPSPTKRERMLQWLEGKPQPGYTPAAFFLHFDDKYHVGLPAAKKHLEYFRFTDMDFVKIQYEQQYKPVDFIHKPSDWSKLKANKLDFYEPQLQTVKEIVKQTKKEALIIMTIYSPYMWAGQTSSYTTLWNHLHEDPEQVKKGLEALVESQLIFVRKCMELGVDGFYMSTQGSDSGKFSDPDIFLNYIKPSDLVAMKEVTSKCPFNILHVCDYVAPYDNYNAVVDYPGQVVNCNTRLTNKELSWQQVAEMFKRPNMGGMDRHGVISNGTPDQIEVEVKRVLSQAPSQFILGADCTVDGNTDWSKLKHAIATAHGK